MQFQAAFRFSQDGQLLLTKSGKVLAANPAICKLLGYTMAEILDKERTDLIDEDDERVKKVLQARNLSGSAIGELDLIHQNGEHIPVEASTILFEIEEAVYASVTVRDLRPRLALEAQKQRTDNFVRMLMDNTEESFFCSTKN